MSPVVAIVGGSKMGKTTLIEKLIPELTSRGHRVATVKHTYHDVAIDDLGKDSRRHIDAGSRATIISSPGRLMLVKPVAADVSLDEVIAVGDGVNDIPLLSAAGLAIAMQDAPDEVKAVADYVTLDVDHSGLAAAIRKFLL